MSWLLRNQPLRYLKNSSALILSFQVVANDNAAQVHNEEIKSEMTAHMTDAEVRDPGFPAEG